MERGMSDRALTRATYTAYDVSRLTGSRTDTGQLDTSVSYRFELVEVKILMRGGINMASLSKRESQSVDMLVAIFRVAGFATCTPVIVDRTRTHEPVGRIIDGKVRVLAAWLAGLESIPAFVVV